jgi:hypothetical protein
MQKSRFWLLVLMCLVPAVLRTVDHPWNFAAIGAVALFAGAYFQHKSWAFLVTMLAMFLGDLGLGITRQNIGTYTFHHLMPFTYGCYALSVCLGFGIRRSWQNADRKERQSKKRLKGRFVRRALPVAIGTLTGAVLYFLVTNFGVWAFLPTYPKTWSGIVDCYVRALPFFRSTLQSDVFYVVALFGGFELLKLLNPSFGESGLLHADSPSGS